MQKLSKLDLLLPAYFGVLFCPVRVSTVIVGGGGKGAPVLKLVFVPGHVNNPVDLCLANLR